MKKTLWIALGATGLLLAAGAAYAMGHHGGPRHMIADAEDYIDATPQQRQVIDQSAQNIFSVLKSHRQQHGQLVDMLAADQLTVDQIQAYANQRAQEIQDVAKAIAPDVKAIHDVLTPAQRQKLAARAKQHHGHHMQGGFGGPPPPEE